MCMSVEQSLGKINLVVDGTLLENRTFEEIKTVDYSSISDMKIGETFEGQLAKFNIFSSTLSVEKMKNMTNADNPACEETGDFVGWNIKNWVLSGSGGAVRELEFAERPCRRVSDMQIYHMEAMHTQAECMEHCQKLMGRSPSVRTKMDWKIIVKEVTTIAGNTSNIKTLPTFDLLLHYPNYPIGMKLRLWAIQSSRLDREYGETTTQELGLKTLPNLGSLTMKKK